MNISLAFILHCRQLTSGLFMSRIQVSSNDMSGRGRVGEEEEEIQVEMEVEGNGVRG